ncbi:transcriptional regulator, TetR family [Kribbella flavida DSM 17836]|uniref:Transcriptional regulator, TetR family n=1 Tax=Kribbella flavida (strain DSM 17836 / JCM 10339 / NBRC 14399) TaxID=479435 RepID=D2PLX2_KRIFD|nr:TetR family transcriptional regulator [Kribbella flavida]ADB32552.1 transcriptional regulator, TetR family [Kribbella flavida DSM 17836]
MDGRTRNAERSKAALLDAALTEFADHGLAGARVSEVARRAGVNKQLISYHFGGKQGLYDAVIRGWQEQERSFRAESASLGDLAVRYLEAVTADPRWAKLTARAILDAGARGASADDDDSSDLSDLHRRKQQGELADDLDPAAVLLAITGMVTAPVLYGPIPGNYADQLRRIVDRLKA